MSRRLLLLNLVLVTAAVVFSVHIVRIFVASPKLPASPPLTARPAERAPTEASARSTPALATFDLVARRNLFNPSRSETATAAASPVAKPLLYGIVLKDGAPAAFLEDPVTKRVLGYKVGDQVPGGQLERIEADRVVIRRGEEKIEVLLRDPTKAKAVTVAQPGAPASQPSPPGGIPQVQAPPMPPVPQQPSPTLFRRPQAPAAPPVRNAPAP